MLVPDLRGRTFQANFEDAAAVPRVGAVNSAEIGIRGNNLNLALERGQSGWGHSRNETHGKMKQKGTQSEGACGEPKGTSRSHFPFGRREIIARRQQC